LAKSLLLAIQAYQDFSDLLSMGAVQTCASTQQQSDF